RKEWGRTPRTMACAHRCALCAYPPHIDAMTAIPLLLEDSRGRAQHAADASLPGDNGREAAAALQRARDERPTRDRTAALASLRQLSYLRFVAVGAQVIAMLTAHLADL